MRFVAGFATALVVVVAAGIAVIWAGWYNVAATEPHSPIGRLVLDAAKVRSVATRADELAPPLRFTEDEVRAGARHFAETCVVCHGGPGTEPSEIGRGMRPRPPDLAMAATRWDTAELFWIVKNGLRMTGMPAFGATHEDGELWRIVAFVGRLSEITPEQFRQIAEAAPAAGGRSD